VLWNIPQSFTTLTIVILLLLLFLFSYRKQTNFITKRIDANNTPNNA